jgi:hypothetical protein
VGDSELTGTFTVKSGKSGPISLHRMALSKRHDGTWKGTAGPRDLGRCARIDYKLIIRAGQIWGETTAYSKSLGTLSTSVSGFVDGDDRGIIQIRGHGGFSAVGYRYSGKFDGDRFNASDHRSGCDYDISWQRNGN